MVDTIDLRQSKVFNTVLLTSLKNKLGKNLVKAFFMQ